MYVGVVQIVYPLNGVKHLYINLACLSVCLSVCLYPINVKTAEPIGPKFFEGHQNEIFCENPRIIFVLFYDVLKENMFTINLEDGREAPYKASMYNYSPFI